MLKNSWAPTKKLYKKKKNYHMHDAYLDVRSDSFATYTWTYIYQANLVATPGK